MNRSPHQEGTLPPQMIVIARPGSMVTISSSPAFYNNYKRDLDTWNFHWLYMRQICKGLNVDSGIPINFCQPCPDFHVSSVMLNEMLKIYFINSFVN